MAPPPMPGPPPLNPPPPPPRPTAPPPPARAPPPPPPPLNWAKLSLDIASGSTSASAAAILKTFRLLIFGSISGIHVNPRKGVTFPSPAPLVRDCEPVRTRLYGR